MSHRTLTVAALVFALAISAPPGSAQDGAAMPAMHEVITADLEWSPLEVPGFASGLELAVVHGDPSVADAPYTLRLVFPDGYRFPPHWHPRAENVTVLEGKFRLAMGRSFDEEKLKDYGPGDYLFIAAENAHYGEVDGRTLIQLHGIGPFDVQVVEGKGM